MLTLENISFDVEDAKGDKGIIKNLSLTIEDGSFVVTAEIYGDMGLDFWLNGQRDVEILEGGYEEGAKTET